MSTIYKQKLLTFFLFVSEELEKYWFKRGKNQKKK